MDFFYKQKFQKINIWYPLDYLGPQDLFGSPLTIRGPQDLFGAPLTIWGPQVLFGTPLTNWDLFGTPGI